MPSHSATAAAAASSRQDSAEAHKRHRHHRHNKKARGNSKLKQQQQPEVRVSSVFPIERDDTAPPPLSSGEVSSPALETCGVSSASLHVAEPTLNIEPVAEAEPSSVLQSNATDTARADTSNFSPLQMSGARKTLEEGTPAPSFRTTRRGPLPPPLHATTAAKNTADMVASVHAKGHLCTLTYSATKDSLRITRASASGKTRTVLNIPVHMIINVETAAEREERQRMRQTNDEAIKLVFAESSGGAGLLCAATTGNTAEEGDPLVFAHSRVNTEASASGANYYGSLLWPQHSLTSPSAVSHNATSPLATGQVQIRYSIHYMRQRNRERPSIHTLEFVSHGPAEHVQAVATAVVQRVYHHGPKHILIFISPKSGKGRGEHIFDKHVRPLLHFSRHTYQTYITQRAHDCEDYVANLRNPLDAGTVVVAVGGDGMINEVVNGVHRRKLALVRWLRSVTTDVTGRGFTEDNTSQRLGDEGSSSAFGLEPQVLATLSDGTSTTAVPTKSPHTPDAHRARATSSPAREAPNIHPLVDENKRERNSTPMDTTAVAARQLARRLVEEGWDALMPFVATVPTGSACGMAKSLDVLSVAESAMALVHLCTVHMDLLHMNFTPNKELMEWQRSKFSLKKMTAAKQSFAKYCSDNKTELQERAAQQAEVRKQQHALQQQQRQEHGMVHVAGAVSAADPTPPFLKDGSNVYTDEVSHALKMPHFDSRVAFMSLSFGTANDIDHGSEPLRWMGNARFHVYGGYMMLLGLQRYNGVLRYLPWQSKTGLTLEKVHSRQKMPSTNDLPPCTMREDCPHCQEYTATHCGQGSLASSTNTAEKHTGKTPKTGRESMGVHGGCSAAATLAAYTDAELLDEDAVDFANNNLPWVTIRGEFCIALLCNVRDVAQDMLMAPLSHMSDGAIDVVYSRIDPCTGKGGRMEMLKFFMGLEAGRHVEQDFVNYVKARALDIKVDSGISMSDGELMPLSSVRMTKLRSSIQLVRNE